MKNPYLIKCYWCKKIIDKRKATTDKEHEYAHFKIANVYLHLKSCLDKYEHELRATYR